MICPNCSTENEVGAKFCNECGTLLAAGCPTCGATNKPGAKFCNECGTPLVSGAAGAGVAPQATGTPSPSRAVQSVAERRLVTVLFADIVGFTPFAEQKDAEEVRDTLSRYFDLCSDIVSRYGGTIEKFIGDAVMAVWGAPVAHEDDAERAVRAALEIVDAVRTLGEGVEARAGLLTGEAAVTLGATNQGMVAGDLVNTAARLQSVAEPGKVLVGEATMRASSNAIAFEAAGEQELKGKQAPVSAWRAIRVVAERGGRNRSEMLEAPFVGRSDELRLMKDLLHATGRESRTRLISVMGPAGIGKSRMAWEFLKYIDGLVETVYWHSGRSPAYGEGITFWALGEMIRGRCDLSEGDDETTTREKVSATVAEWIPDEAERNWVQPALLTLLGLSSDSATSPDQLFSAWRTFFERISAHGTVALVFEDLHHADTGTLDFIDHLLDWSRGHPILVVTLSRPELLDRRADWGAGKRNFTSIFLEPLPEEEMRELLAGLVPGLPPAAVDAIVQRADGIPLYAVETVRMLLADGRLEEENGVYAPKGDLSTLAVPETLTALISSRLDALDATNRSLIHDAAVLGQSFTVDAVSAVSGIPVKDLEERITALVKRELLSRQMDPRSPEQGQVTFVQALIREVAYNTLSKKDRKVRHLAAARYFEQLGSDELASALAGHYLAAQQNAAEGAEADALAAQARIALKGAAERAVALGAHEQAVAFLQQAMAVTADPSDRAELLERAGDSARIAAKPDVAIPMLKEAVEISRAANDRLGAARAIALQGDTLLDARRDREALDLVEAAHEEFADLWPDPVIARLKGILARALGQFEDNRRSVALADEVLEVAEHGNHKRLLSETLMGKGAALGSLGRLHEGVALIQAGGDLARELGDSEGLLASLMLRGFTLGEVDNLEAARCYREGLELSRRVGHRNFMHQFANNLGYTGFVTGDWDFALEVMGAVLAEDIDSATRTWLLSNWLIIRVSRGDEVERELAQLKELAATHTDPHIAAAPLDTSANAALAAGRYEDAQRDWLASGGIASFAPQSFYQAARAALWAHDLEALRRDLVAIDATGFHGPVVEARRVTVRAGLAALGGRQAEAIALYRDALSAWRGLRVAWEEAMTGLDMVMVLDPSLPEVGAAAASSREILGRLGAKPYLQRLDAALSRSGAAPVPASLAATSRAVPVEAG